MNNTLALKETGETVTFKKSSADTNGEFVEAIFTLPASGDGPPKHRHVHQTEYFEAIDGNLGLDCGDKKIILEPGQNFTVPSDTIHRCYSIDGKDITFKVIIRPALNIEYFLTEIFESCNRNASKAPSTFDATFIMQEIKGEYFLGDVPNFVQRSIFPMIAMMGKLFGFVKAKSKTEYLKTKMHE